MPLLVLSAAKHPGTLRTTHTAPTFSRRNVISTEATDSPIVRCEVDPCILLALASAAIEGPSVDLGRQSCWQLRIGSLFLAVIHSLLLPLPLFVFAAARAQRKDPGTPRTTHTARAHCLLIPDPCSLIPAFFLSIPQVQQKPEIPNKDAPIGHCRNVPKGYSQVAIIKTRIKKARSLSGWRKRVCQANSSAINILDASHLE
jgi:hypothetical protein